MPSVIEPLRVDGLVQLQKTLKDIDGEAQKELRDVLNTAADIVAKGARRRVHSRTGRAAGSIRAASQQRSAVVQEGGGKAPYVGALDYGNVRHGGRGAVGRGDSAGLPFVRTGRVLYPAYLAQKDNVQAVLERGLFGLVEKHGLAVTHGG